MARVIKQLALDTNVLMDLGAGYDLAHTFRELALEKGYALRVTPTVVQELEYLTRKGDTQQLRHEALVALQNMIEWSIQPYDLIPVGHGITESFSREIREKGILPDSEINDGIILAEVSLAQIKMLISSDKHLLDADPQLLSVAFSNADLEPVSVMRPRDFARALG